MHEAFGANSIPEESTLFQAVCGFMEGSQEGYDDTKWFVTDYVKRLYKKESEGKTIRATKFGRKELLTRMVAFMYRGEVAKHLEENVLRRKRFSTVKLARVSDMNMQACFPPFGQTFEFFGKQHSSLFNPQSSAPHFIKVSKTIRSLYTVCTL